VSLLHLVFQVFLSLILFLLLDVQYFSLSDDNKPKKDATVVPFFGTLTIPEGHSQEETAVAKTSPAPLKKNPTEPPSKRQKRGAAATASLEVHQPSASSDNVNIDACTRLYLFLNS
jgi:hypothetical protein